MTPEALICTSDFELSHMVRLAVERFGITVGIALSPTDALQQLEHNKFDLVVVDCSDLERGCAALRKMRLNPTHRSAVAIAVVIDREHAKYVCNSGANFVVAHVNYETEIVATLRSAYGLVLRERGRYNRFVLDTEVTVQSSGQHLQGRILNLSQGGVCVVGMSQRLAGRVQLCFALEEGKPLIQVTGNVAWQREQRMGVQFTSMSTANRTELDAWLAKQFEVQAKTQMPAASVARADFELPDSTRTAVYGNAEGIHPIVTAIIRGGPVRARCSACQATITFGNSVGAALEQERKLREAFVAHVREKHETDLAAVLAGVEEFAHASSAHR